MLTLSNINSKQPIYSVVKKQRIMGSNSKSKYRLLEPLEVQLSNGDFIRIPRGFEWDGSSVPRFLWWLLPPDGDFELGALIHDYLYEQKAVLGYSRSFSDKEMLIWSRQCSGRKKVSLRNIDNYVRYGAVRLFGWAVWNGWIRIK